MRVNNEENPRELIPRIRDYKTTALLGELDTFKPIENKTILNSNNELERKIEEWKNEKSISFAADLLNSAIVTNNKEVMKDVASYILKSEIQKNSNSMLFSLAKSVVNDDLTSDFEQSIVLKEEIMKNIREKKNNLKLNPRNSIAWCELSRLYVLMNQYGKAMEALNNAIIINPNNRYVIRTAVGFYVHLNKPEEAKYILNKSGNFKIDPWLIASDIVLSEMISKTSRLITDGKRLIESKNYSNKSLTELTSALATLELISGKNKKAKTLFAKSLLEPTDNTLAQATWAASFDSNVVDMTKISNIKVPLDYEAKFYQYKKDNVLDNALIQVSNWIKDQPFSKEAYYHGSYVAAVGLRKFKVAENLIAKGLEYTPNDFLLLNNLTFSYLQQNKIIEAEEAYKKLTSSFNSDTNEIDRMVFNATTGLLNYKTKNFEIGRQKYEEAIKFAKTKGYKREEGLCKIYLATEEFIRDSASFNVYYEDAVNTCKNIDEIEVKNELQYLKNLIDNKH